MKRIIDVNKLLEYIKELQEAECSLSADELIDISEPYGFLPLTDGYILRGGDEFLILSKTRKGVKLVEWWEEGGYFKEFGTALYSREDISGIMPMPIPGGE